jgi:hypothetical protein
MIFDGLMDLAGDYEVTILCISIFMHGRQLCMALEASQAYTPCRVHACNLSHIRGKPWYMHVAYKDARATLVGIPKDGASKAKF